MTGSSRRQFTNEELMTFADGEADPALKSALAAALERDRALAERLEIFRSTARSLKHAFPPQTDREADRKIAAAMQEALRAENATAHRESSIIAFPARRTLFENRWVGAAAAAVILGIGLVSGYLAGQRTLPAVQFAAGAAADMAEAFAKLASGSSVQVEGGKLTLIATYRSARGELCREYELDAPAPGKMTGLACIHANEWRTIAQIFSETEGAGYIPAGEDELVEALAARAGMTGPLTEAEEAEIFGK